MCFNIMKHALLVETARNQCHFLLLGIWCPDTYRNNVIKSVGEYAIIIPEGLNTSLLGPTSTSPLGKVERQRQEVGRSPESSPTRQLAQMATETGPLMSVGKDPA